MRNKTPLAVFFCAATVLATATFYEVRVSQSEARVEAITTTDRISAEPPTSTLAGETARMQRAYQLYDIWQQRDRKNITSDVLPYLQDADFDISQTAVTLLGRLEDPTAEPALQAIAKRFSSPLPEQQSLVALRVKFALGRIHSRDLRGKTKLQAIATDLGLTLDELARVSARVNGKVSPAKTMGVGEGAEELVWRIVDLLYGMERKGEDISTIRNLMTFNALQQIELDGAKLSPDQEAVSLLNLIFKTSVYMRDERRLMQDHLVSIGEPATKAILQRLEDMKAHPERYSDDKYATRYNQVFAVAARTGDLKAVPLLAAFESDPNPWVSANVGVAKAALINKRWFPPFSE